MELSQKHRDEVLKLIPDDEIDRVFAACVELFEKWRASAPRIDSFEEPRGTDIMDRLVRETLLPLARGGVDKSLAKLAVVSTWVYDPDASRGQWAAPENVVDAVLYQRLGDSDVFLTELRDLRHRKENDDWMMTFRGLNGRVTEERERIFPLWPLEIRLGLDSFEKAFAFYENECKARMLA